MCFLPESPVWLTRNGKMDLAEKSISWFMLEQKYTFTRNTELHPNRAPLSIFKSKQTNTIIWKVGKFLNLLVCKPPTPQHGSL